MKRIIILCCIVMCSMEMVAQQTDTVKNSKLGAVKIRSHKKSDISRISGAENGLQIGQGELFRAACCNLGESFINNASVDVNYNDAAVGARQIKLLGLSGQYVQMLTEGLPASLGASMPYTLGYVPGSWMKNISVSKGASSVKNGPQSITGQINVEYLKPEIDTNISLNFFVDSRLKSEINFAKGFIISPHKQDDQGHVHTNADGELSTIVLAHFEHDFMHHDDNGDKWQDSPAITQLHLQDRWKYTKGRYIMHAGIGYLLEKREGGQVHTVATPYKVTLDASRLEAYMKHAFLINKEHNTNIALLANAYVYSLDGTFGWKYYNNDHLSFNSRVVLEHDFNEDHNISAGLSLNGDHMKENLNPPVNPYPAPPALQHYWQTDNYVPGIYAQYTYIPSYKLTAMLGLRADYSSLYENAFVTPRLHVKWVTTDWMTMRASTGKGYRTPYAIAENHYLLSSGRTLEADRILPQEEAWNSGISMNFYIPVGQKKLKLNAEYYYTDFQHQAVVDYDRDPTKITISDLDGTSFSHTAQVDATYDFTESLNILAAFRYNYVRCTYGAELLEKPLTSRYKGLVTLSWKPMMELWQFDVTLALNGGGRMPKPYIQADGTPSWDEEFPAYPQLSAQVTREFRHFSVYVGGENLTNYTQPNPIINADRPWSPEFEPTLIWGPVHGIMAYAGIRMKL